MVLVHGDNGLTGIGESDAPPEIVRAAIEMATYNNLAEGLADIVTGQAVDDPRRLWDEMYTRTQWIGRRGAAICAISALDIAIWDLFAQSKGIPICEALGGARHARLPAYATIYPLADTPARASPRRSAPLARSGLSPPQDLRGALVGGAGTGDTKTSPICAASWGRTAA